VLPSEDRKCCLLRTGSTGGPLVTVYSEAISGSVDAATEMMSSLGNGPAAGGSDASVLPAAEWRVRRRDSM